MTISILLAAGFILLVIAVGVRVINEYERGVVLRLGKYQGNKTPGLTWIIPMIDQMVKVDLRTIAKDVPPQDIITKDNVSVKVNAVIYFRVVHPEKAILEVENYLYATTQMAQTNLRSTLGQVELDELLSKRDKINEELQHVLDTQTDPWGIKVSNVELKHVDLPHEMQRAMAKQAEAERERRAKIIASDGEFQASHKLTEAADIISKNPAALQLRFLQTLAEVATENNTTTIFPIPIDLFKPFIESMEKSNSKKE